MKNFSSLMESLPSRSIVISYAKFDPPSIKHKQLIEYTKNLALENNAKHLILVRSNKNSILPINEKLGYLKEFFPDTVFKLVESTNTLERIIKSLSLTYKTVHLVSSIDQLAEVKILRDDLLGSFKDILIEQTTESNYDCLSDTLKMLSESGDFKSFKSHIFENIRDLDARRLMNVIRQSLNLDPIKEEMKIERDNLREMYLRAEIFNIDDIIESNGVKYSIIARGSNYLTVMDESGGICKKWLHECNTTQINASETFNRAKENMHYKKLAAYKEKLTEEPVVNTTQTNNLGQSVLRYRDFKRLLDASNGIVTDNPDQKHESVEPEKVESEKHSKSNKKTDDVKILKSANRVEEDVHSADYSYNPHTGRRFRAHLIKFGNSRHAAQLQRVAQDKEQKPVKTEPMVKRSTEDE